MKKAILTTISDSRKPEFSSDPKLDIFLNSLKKETDADLIIFSDVLNRDLPHLKCPLFKNVLNDRWLCYYRFLCQTDYDYVLLTDAKDVYFQADPFKFAGDKLLFAGEGLTHGESEWNYNDQLVAQKVIGSSGDISDWPVVNGGIFLGPAKTMRDLAILMHTNIPGRAFNYDNGIENTFSDQAVINNIWNNYLCHNPSYALANPDYDTFCVTGDTLKCEKNGFSVLFESGKVTNQNGEPYAIFHQWERTRYADDILKRFV